MFRREVAFFPGIRFEIEQLPRVLLVFLVEPPVLPADGDQVSADRVSWFIVEPEQILMRIAGSLAPQVGK